MTPRPTVCLRNQMLVFRILYFLSSPPSLSST